jgi:class 3 adenylate cyclase
VVDSPGDNVLAEFGSVVDAVQCAVEIQKELKARNADLPDNRKMEFRIGINLGDVIKEGKRIYGDGVNIAARVEGLAAAYIYMGLQEKARASAAEVLRLDPRFSLNSHEKLIPLKNRDLIRIYIDALRKAGLK